MIPPGFVEARVGHSAISLLCLIDIFERIFQFTESAEGDNMEAERPPGSLLRRHGRRWYLELVCWASRWREADRLARGVRRAR